jgi:ABC-type antimicrobial peptide transport system permease subunit
LKKFIFFFLLYVAIVFPLAAPAQDSTLSIPKLQVSVLTCAAGEDIYTVWGHTAVRVIDSTKGTDIVFNYGTFDFNEPNFLAKFVKGSLLYFVSANYYADFLAEYKFDKREVVEQVLRLSASEKIKWYEALKVNMIDSNRYYLYNFITDNCTTRIKDGLFKNSAFQPVGINIHSFRTEVVEAPYKHGLPWIGLGIDLLLGAFSDQKPTDFQAAYLPFLFHQQMANTRKLVMANNILVSTNQVENKQKSNSSNTPLYTLLILLCVYLFASKWNSLATQKLATVLDTMLLLTFSVGGLLVMYMSLFSKHTACYQNYNLMWMHPLYLIAIIFYFIKNEVIGKIGMVFFAATIALVLTSYWLPQHFSIEVWVLIGIALQLNYRLIKKGQLNRLFKKA